MATASSNADIQMEALIWLPVDYPSVATVEELLRKRDVLTSGHERLGVDFFDPATYIHNQLPRGASFCFRYDRNVLSRLVEVVHGKPMSEEHRLACGIQALAQITEAVVEPNIGRISRRVAPIDWPPSNLPIGRESAPRSQTTEVVWLSWTAPIVNL